MKVYFLDEWGQESSIMVSTDDQEIASIFVKDFPGNPEVAIDLYSGRHLKDQERASVTFWSKLDGNRPVGASVQVIYQEDRSFLFQIADGEGNILKKEIYHVDAFKAQ